MYAFRDLAESDLEWFVSVRNQVRKSLHDQREFSLTDARSWFSMTHVRYIVVEWQYQKIGYVRSRTYTRHSVEIGLDLDPLHQARGHAKPIYRQLAMFYWKRGVSHFVLRVLNSNERAVALYEGLTFKSVRLLEGVDDYFMVASVKDLIGVVPNDLLSRRLRQITPDSLDAE